MAKLQMLSFDDDDIIAQRIKEESNYCDMANLVLDVFDAITVELPTRD